MRYPDFLKDNGTIGFVAPSFGCATQPYRSAFDSALDQLGRLGYVCKLGENCYADKGIGISNTPALCARELTDFYCDPAVNVLISCGGGELMCETVSQVDFERIAAAPPKWYLGYSDNTNFTFLLTTCCDTASVYGPCAGAFGMQPWHPAVSDTLAVLTGKAAVDNVRPDFLQAVTLRMQNYDGWERDSLKTVQNPTAAFNITEPYRMRCYDRGRVLLPASEKRVFEGRLLGGCMDCLVTLLGTAFDRVTAFCKRYAADGFIWFLESCDLNVFGIRRAVWQMQQAGWFEHVKGFLIGRPMVYGQEMMGLDQYEAVLGLLAQYEVPVVMDVDLGHLPPSMPVVCGSLGRVQVCENRLVLDMTLC